MGKCHVDESTGRLKSYISGSYCHTSTDHHILIQSINLIWTCSRRVITHCTLVLRLLAIYILIYVIDTSTKSIFVPIAKCITNVGQRVDTINQLWSSLFRRHQIPKSDDDGAAYETSIQRLIRLHRGRIVAITFYFILPSIGIFVTFCCIVFGFPIYIVWLIMVWKRKSSFHTTGSLMSQSIRDSCVWRWVADSFRMRLMKTTDLPPHCPILFGYHPHGALAFGALINFATNATNFNTIFPNVRVHLMTLSLNFGIIAWRNLLGALGIVDASRQTCRNILKNVLQRRQCEQQALCIVIGGARESFHAHPGSARIDMKRKGFVKVALECGAALVPVYSFGENDLFHQYIVNGLRGIQRFILHNLKFAPIFIWPIPRFVRITTVVGSPIRTDLQHNFTQLSTCQQNQIIGLFHAQYVRALEKLYDDHKSLYDARAELAENLHIDY